MTPTFFVRAGVTLSLAAVLAACGSSVKLDETAVENRTPSSVEGATTADANAAKGGAQSQVATVNTATANTNPLEPLPAGVGRVVYFDYDSFVVREDARTVVEAHARLLINNARRAMVVEGHTDERGGSEYNLALGQKRAEAVVKTLTLLGAKPSQLEAVSFGKERPADAGHNEAAWAKNRRAEIKDRQ